LAEIQRVWEILRQAVARPAKKNSASIEFKVVPDLSVLITGDYDLLRQPSDYLLTLEYDELLALGWKESDADSRKNQRSNLTFPPNRGGRFWTRVDDWDVR
jgi:hypothetical protein